MALTSQGDLPNDPKKTKPKLGVTTPSEVRDAGPVQPTIPSPDEIPWSGGFGTSTPMLGLDPNFRAEGHREDVIDAIEGATNGILPTDYVWALSQSGMGGSRLQTAARMLAQDLDVRPDVFLEQQFVRFKDLPDEWKPALRSFKEEGQRLLDPETGRFLTMESARRRIPDEQQEVRLFKYLLDNTTLPTHPREQITDDPLAVAQTWRLIGDAVNTRDISYEEAVGAAVAVSRLVDPKNLGEFYESLKFMGPEDINLATPQKIHLAARIAANGQKVTNRIDLLKLIAAFEGKDQAEIDKLDKALRTGEIDPGLWQSTGEGAAGQILPTGSEKVLGKFLAGDKVDYHDTVRAITKGIRAQEASWDNSILGTTFGAMADGFNAATAWVNGNLVKGAGYLSYGINSVLGQVYERIPGMDDADIQEFYEDRDEALESALESGDDILDQSSSLSRELIEYRGPGAFGGGVPPWLAASTEVGITFGLDPLILAGKAIHLRRMLRFMPYVLNRSDGVIRMADNLVAAGIFPDTSTAQNVLRYVSAKRGSGWGGAVENWMNSVPLWNRMRGSSETIVTHLRNAVKKTNETGDSSHITNAMKRYVPFYNVKGMPEQLAVHLDKMAKQLPMVDDLLDVYIQEALRVTWGAKAPQVSAVRGLANDLRQRPHMADDISEWAQSWKGELQESYDLLQDIDRVQGRVISSRDEYKAAQSRVRKALKGESNIDELRNFAETRYRDAALATDDAAPSFFAIASETTAQAEANRPVWEALKTAQREYAPYKRVATRLGEWSTLERADVLRTIRGLAGQVKKDLLKLTGRADLDSVREADLQRLFQRGHVKREAVEKAQAAADQVFHPGKLPDWFNEMQRMQDDLYRLWETRKLKAHFLSYRAGPLRSSFLSLDEALANTAVGRAWRAMVNKVPTTTADIEQHFGDWTENFLKRSRSFTDAEIAKYRLRAVEISNPFYQGNRRGDFVKFLADIQEETIRRHAKALGLDQEESLRFIRGLDDQVRKRHAEIYGFEVDSTFNPISRVGAAGQPLDVTQTVNKWSVLDPIHIRTALRDASGTWGRFNGAFRRATGKAPKRSLRDNRGPYGWARDLTGEATNTFYKYWKPLVVVDPNYLFRVPLGDEQIRFMGDLGFLTKLMSTRTFGRALKGARKLTGAEDPHLIIDVAASYADNINQAVNQAGFSGWEQALDTLRLSKSGTPLTRSQAQLVEHLDRLAPDMRNILETTLAEGENVLKMKVYLPDPSLMADDFAAAVAGRGEEVWTTFWNEQNARHTFRAQAGGKRYWDDIYPVRGLSPEDMERLKSIDDLPPVERIEVREEILSKYRENPEHLPAWSNALENQLGRGPLARIVLRGIADDLDPATIQANVVKFLEGEGDWVRIQLGLRKGDIDSLNAQAADTYAVVVNATQHNRELATAVFNMDVEKIHQIVKNTPVWHRPRINGMRTDNAVGFGTQTFTNSINSVMRFILQTATNNVTRHPYTRTWKSIMQRSLLKQADEQGIKMTPDILRAINEESRAFAIERLNKIMFNFRTQSRFGEMFGFAFPFFQPFAESLLVYSHLFRQNPAMLGYSRAIWQQLDKHLTVNDEGQQVISMRFWLPATFANWMVQGLRGGFALATETVAGDPGEGWDRFKEISVTNPFDLKSQAEEMFGSMEGNLPGDWSFYAPLEQLAFFFTSSFDLPTGKLAGNFSIPVPSASTPLLAPLQMLAEKMPDAEPGTLMSNLKNSVLDYVFAYGDVRGAGLVPAVLPTYIRNIATSMGAFNEGMVDNLANEFVRMMDANTKGQFITALTSETPYYISENGAYTTKKPMSQRQAMRYINESARAAAKELITTRAWINLFTPAAAQVSMPTEELNTELRELVDQWGYTRGTEIFKGRHEEDGGLIAFVTAATFWADPESEVSIPSNELANRILNAPEFENFARENPRWAFALLPSEVWDEDFDRVQWMRDLHTGLRQTKRTYGRTQSGADEGFLVDIEVARGWDAWRVLTDRRDRLRDNLGPQATDGDEAWQSIDQWYTDEIAKIQLNNPAWAAEYVPLNTLSIDPKVEDEMRRLREVDVFTQTNVGGFIDDYFDMRDPIYDELYANNISGINNVAATELRKTYKAGVKELIDKYGADAERVYDIYLNNDLGQIRTERDDIEASYTPEQRRELNRVQQDYRHARKATTLSDNDYERSVAFRRLGRVTAESIKMDPDPISAWYEQMDPLSQNRYRASVLLRPMIFQSEWDRKIVLGVKTTKAAEDGWQKIVNAGVQIDRWEQAHPGESAAAAGLYEQRDKLVRQLTRNNPVFRRQIQRANTNGWAIRNLYTPEPTILPGVKLEQQEGPAGRAWRLWFKTLDEWQRAAVKNEMTGVDDFDDTRRAQYQVSAQVLERYMEDLGEFSPLFRKQWDALDQSLGTDPLMGYFWPDVAFPLGGFEFANKWGLATGKDS